MYKFVDEIRIRVKAGNGGPGAISFRREKFVPMGGPDGGDGGRGGDIYLQPDQRVLNFSHLHKDRLYKAWNGRNGSGNNRSGSDGKDHSIKVPVGTVVYSEEGELIHDCLDETPFCLAKGGRGGKGNAHFKSSTFQAPRFSQPGEDSEPFTIILSLKLIADIGLIGLPNAGKSTLLKTLTHAAPKIGNYPFTTLSPNLGTLEITPAKTLVIADIPGIIEGASMGHGLGLSFLKHIERVRLLVFVLDVATANVEDELNILRKELDEYNPELNKRPHLVVFNKSDLVDPEFLSEWMESFQAQGIRPIAISATENKGIEELLSAMRKLV